MKIKLIFLNLLNIINDQNVYVLGNRANGFLIILRPRKVLEFQDIIHSIISRQDSGQKRENLILKLLLQYFTTYSESTSSPPEEWLNGGFVQWTSKGKD